MTIGKLRPRTRPALGMPVVGALALVTAANAQAPATAAHHPTESALQICERAEKAPDHEKESLISEAIRLADEAVGKDPKHGRAHFAVFCGLGLQLQEDGLSFSTMSKLKRLKAEIHLAHKLSPDDPDILAAKGAMLLQLPGMFGGDSTEAEKLLRRALNGDRDNPRTREFLAEAMEANGRYRLAELVRKAGAEAIEQ